MKLEGGDNLCHRLWQNWNLVHAHLDASKPIGVSEYELTQAPPDTLKSSLPTVEEIEAELTRRTEGGP